MPARVVLPSAAFRRGGLLAPAVAETGSPPRDLEDELRRAVTRAAEAQGLPPLASDTLDELACVACEVLQDESGNPEARLQEAVEPLLEGTSHSLKWASGESVLRALLEAAGADVSTTDSCRLPPPPRPTPVAAPTSTVAPESGTGGVEETNAAEVEPSGEPRRWLSRGEVERNRAEAYLRERAVQVAAERQAQAEREVELEAFYGRNEVSSLPEPPPASADASGGAVVVVGAAAPGADQSDSSEEEDDEATIRDREATKSRLRELGEPVSLFGENDERRLQRLQRLELCRDQDVLASGSTNVMQILDRRRQRNDVQGMVPSSLAVASAGGGSVTAGGVPSGGAEAAAAEDDLEMELEEDEAGADAEEEVDQDTKVVITWLRTVLREWESTLRARPEKEQASAAFKTEKAQFRQSKQYLKPLRRTLKSREVNPNIVASLANLAKQCEERRYREAQEAYMKLAIGNSPWPMGVTFVTFHDRPGRHNIGEHSAHVLDDETTRKYIQMVKRLLSFCETRWPSDSASAPKGAATAGRLSLKDATLS